jgi:hypothetical protein
LFFDLPVEKANLSLGVFGDVFVVCDYDKRFTLFAQAVEDVEDVSAACAVEVSCGFVGKDNQGVVGERPCDGDPLLLTAA